MQDIYRHRLGNVQLRMCEEGLDFLFIPPSPDLLYLTGVAAHPTERLTLLVLPAQDEPSLLLPAFEVSEAVPPFKLATWEETDDPYRTLMDVLEVEVTRPLKIAVGDKTWAFTVLHLQESFPRATFVPASRILAPMRMIKQPDEVATLREVNQLADEVFEQLLTVRMVGLEERALSRRLQDLLHEAGNDSAAFASVASGPHSASPHHQPGDRVIQEGDVVLFDFGGRLHGYHSDVSRTIAVSYAPEAFEIVYATVRKAQQAAVEAIRSGVSLGEIDDIAREVITEAGYGANFTHRVGHGLGLDVHEPPYLTGDNRQALEVGMCFSIEPGIYLPGRFGVRIEDSVLVTEAGSERLNHASRELMVVRG